MKTLKELQQCNIKQEVFLHECGNICGVLTAKDLRQEAIKWIEYLKTERKLHFEGTKKFHVTTGYCAKNNDGWSFHNCDNIINWIKHFFNISDEDLQ